MGWRTVKINNIFKVVFMLSYKRSQRVGELIQQELAHIVQEIKDPGIGFVTITGVKLADDLLDARVFYSVIGSPADIERTSAILKGHLPEIRHQLAQRVKLRRTPSLFLVFDETPRKADRIFELLGRIDEENKEPKEHSED